MTDRQELGALPRTLDDYVDAYNTEVQARAALQRTTELAIDQERAIIEAAEARITELTSPLRDAAARVRYLATSSQAFGRSAMKDEGLVSSRRALGGLMSEATSPEEAMKGALNFALLQASVDAGERPPVLIGEEGRVQGIRTGILTGCDVSIVESEHLSVHPSGIVLTLAQSSAFKPISSTRIDLQPQDDGVVPAMVGFKALLGDVFSADSVIFAPEKPPSPREPVPPRSPRVRGLIVGQEALEQFFIKYAAAFEETTPTTSLERNPVYQLWSSYNRIGVVGQLPEGVRETWKTMAGEAIVESVVKSLTGSPHDTSNTPYMLKAFVELGGNDNEAMGLIIHGYAKVTKINTKEALSTPNLTIEY